MDVEKQKRIKDAEESIRQYFETTFSDKHSAERREELHRDNFQEDRRLRLEGLSFVGQEK